MKSKSYYIKSCGNKLMHVVITSNKNKQKSVYWELDPFYRQNSSQEFRKHALISYNVMETTAFTATVNQARMITL